MKSTRLIVPHVRQHAEGECVAACAAMMLGYMGFSVAYDQLLKILDASWFGTPFFKLRELEKLGVAVIYKQGSLRELHEHLLNDRPCIAFVRTSELPYWDTERRRRARSASAGRLPVKCRRCPSHCLSCDRRWRRAGSGAG